MVGFRTSNPATVVRFHLPRLMVSNAKRNKHNYKTTGAFNKPIYRRRSRMSRLKQLLHTTTKRGAAYKFIERFALKHMSSTAPSELNQRSILLDKERVVTYAYSVQKISLFRALRQNMKLGNVDGW